MKPYLLLIFAPVVFFACQKNIDSNPIPTDQIDPVFLPYFFDFIDEMHARVPEAYIDTGMFVIQFDTEGIISEIGIGKCPKIGGHEILISRTYWETADETYRRALMFHELGHCALARFHDGQTLRYKICKSLMTPVNTGGNCGIDYYSPMWYDFYMDELFGIKEAPDWLEVGENYMPEQPMADTFFLSSNSSVSIPTGQTDNFQIELFFSEMGTVDISFGRYRLHMLNQGFLQTNGQTTIFLDDKQFIKFPFLNGYDWREETPMKYTLRFQDGMFYFFFNEKLVHNREADVDSNSMIVHVQEGLSSFEKIVATR